MDDVNVQMNLGSNFGSRKFYEIKIPSYSKGDDLQVDKEEAVQKLFNYVEGSCVGKDLVFSGPFGDLPVTYCDYTASGRSLGFIEDFIRDEVLPHYGNTHTTTSVTSLQTTLFRHEARTIIRNAVNAGEQDAVIFVSSGVTGAIYKLIHALNLKKPPIVFVSPYEHHSNLLSWKEIGGEIVWTPENDIGGVNIAKLEENLQMYHKSGRPLIGCFSAASNVTGILTDVDAVAACLHKYGGLAFFDYATAAPYVEINMNPLIISETQGLTHKDAVFISPHKFIGGPGTPGILVAKKSLFRNPVPSEAGGGTVFFVTHQTQTYLKEIEMREEAGTPSIIESIRAGLVFQLKEALGQKNIINKEEQLVKRALEFWRNTPNLIILGDHGAKRLSVFSFVVVHPESGRLLHHNFVCTLLNDVFGIQARGGCACAGPYAEDLLGMDEEVALKIESLLLEDQRLDRHHLRRYREYSEREILRPGFARLNLPFFLCDEGVDFVLRSVAMVAEHGWKLLPLYNMNPETGEWRHKKNLVFKDRKWLGAINYRNGKMNYSATEAPRGKILSYQERLDKAWEVIQSVDAKKNNRKISDQTLLLGNEGEKYRWFLLPSEAVLYLEGKKPKKFEMPFFPRKSVKESQMRVKSSSKSSFNHHFCFGCNGALQLGSSSETRPFQDDASRNVLHASLTNNLTLLPCEENGGDGIALDFNDCEGNASLENGGKKISDSCRTTDNNTLSYKNQNSDDKAKGQIEEKLAVSLLGSKISDEPAKGEASTVKAANPCEEVLAHTLNGLHPESNGASTSCMLNKVRGKGQPEVCIKKSPVDVNTKSVIKFHSPPKSIFGPAVEAIEEFSMIQNGDRVLLCLSGGKDSLSMLHTIRQYKFYAKSKGINFEFGAMTVDPKSAAYDPSPLKQYLAKLQVPYFFEEQDIISQAENLPVCESICSFCSRMKRGRMYACARREGYNVLALGQHLDDIAESFFMSVFHNGLLRTMKASYIVKEEDLRVIRPLINVREKDLRDFAEQVKLPVIPENCPACFEAPKERHRTKQLLAHQEVLFPNLFSSIQTALKPLMSKNRTGLESSKNNTESFDEFI